MIADRGGHVLRDPNARFEHRLPHLPLDSHLPLSPTARSVRLVGQSAVRVLRPLVDLFCCGLRLVLRISAPRSEYFLLFSLFYSLIAEDPRSVGSEGNFGRECPSGRSRIRSGHFSLLHPFLLLLTCFLYGTCGSLLLSVDRPYSADIAGEFGEFLQTELQTATTIDRLFDSSGECREHPLTLFDSFSSCSLLLSSFCCPFV